MSVHLLQTPEPRARVSGPDYCGQHRSARHLTLCRPGALVLEDDTGSPAVASSVVHQVDAVTVLVRHVGTCDDHLVRIDALRPFTPTG